MSDENTKAVDEKVSKEMQEIILINEETIQSKIYIVRGQKVMLDFELAEIYGYTTTKFNQQVKNNIEKFDEDFMFQLTKEEFDNLISKNLTSRWGGRRKLPKVFTEQGIYMLMTVLKRMVKRYFYVVHLRRMQEEGLLPFWRIRTVTSITIC